MVDPITLSESVSELGHELSSLSGFVERAARDPLKCAEQLAYTAKKLGDLQTEARVLEDEARQLARGHK